MYEGVSYETLHQGRIKVNANIGNNLDSVTWCQWNLYSEKKWRLLQGGAYGSI